MPASPAQRGQKIAAQPAPKAIAPPVMRVTRYDRVSSFMWALIGGTLLAVGFVVIQWYAIRKPPPIELVPLEMVLGGGYEDGNINDTFEVQSPEQVDPNAAVLEDQQQQELTESLETVIELSDRAMQQVQQVMSQSENTAGTRGSAVGKGGRPLGSGGGPGSGIPAYQRWYIRFNEASSTDYAKQLDHFGIELAVFYPGSGKLSYAKNFSSTPTVTHKDKWEDDRVYFKWSGGPRERIDRELLQKAGISPSGGQIFQFYPNQTVQLLGTIEQSFANRPAKEIRRTYFVVNPQGGGYTFAVTRQTYLN
jgi:hypothetical protein